ncbi:MAG: ABC transporter transmembrane domain-containing protein [Myxococcota bacterium]
MSEFVAARVGRRTLGQIFRPHTGAFLWGVLWLLITNGMSLWLPRLLNRGVEGLRAHLPLQQMVEIALWMVGASLLMAGTRVLSRVYVFNVGRDIEYRLRQDLYAHLCAQPQEFFESRPVGDLMSRAINDLSNVRLLLGFATLNLINTFVAYAGNIPLLIQLDLPLALACMAPYPIVLVVVRVVARNVFSMTKVNQEDLGALSTRIQEHLAGLKPWCGPLRRKKRRWSASRPSTSATTRAASDSPSRATCWDR